MKLPEHAVDDAFVLRNRRVPAERKEQIIVRHADEIEHLARKQSRELVWHDGQLPPKALLAAQYINAMFLAAYNQRPIVSETEMAELYLLHTELMRDGKIMPANPLGYTALSGLAYAADKVQDYTASGSLVEYVCLPTTDTELALAG